MVFLPVGNNRVPFPLSTRLTVDSINSRQSALNKVAYELSTGRRLLKPSDNTSEALRATVLQRAKEQQTQYRENIRQGSASLSFAEDMFRSFTDALDSARQVAVTISDGTRSSADYEAARVQIDGLIDQILSSANRKYLDSHVLAGSNGGTVPFQRDGNQIVFNGDNSTVEAMRELEQFFPINLTADSSVGAYSSAGYGTELLPDVAASTRLRDLNGGAGVEEGFIEIDTGTGAPVEVDLTNADTLQDVLDLVNSNATLSGQGFSIGLNGAGTGLAILAGPNATASIRNVGGGTTASDLGLALSGATIPASGSVLEPALTLTTPLSRLNGGSGVDTSQPLVIQNGPHTASIDLSGATTIEDVLNAINASDVRVQAEINKDGTGINVLNRLSGSAYSIVENSPTGRVAQDLGILTTRLDTALSDFNDQGGVNGRIGEDIEISVADGTVYRIDLAGAATVADVKQIVESATSGAVTVNINPQGGLLLDDTTSGSGSFAVRDIADSYAARDLGIVGTTAGGGNIAGTNAHQARVKGVFDTLLRLRDGLVNRDQKQIGLATKNIPRDQEKVLGAAGALGAQLQMMDALEERITTDLEGIEVETSKLVDADLSETVMKLTREQAALQAALASGGRLLQGSLLDYL